MATKLSGGSNGDYNRYAPPPSQIGYYTEENGAQFNGCVPEDDLRNGTFSYVKESSRLKKLSNIIDENMVLPNTNEIMFNDNLTQSKSYICWKYGEKRALVSVKIQPVPFLIDANIESGAPTTPNLLKRI